MGKLFARVAAIVLLCFMTIPAKAQSAGTVEPVAPATSAAPAPETPPAAESTKPEVKAPPRRHRARHRHYRYRYWRHDPFYASHPRFWWPFYPHRYRYYRHHRRYYHRPFFIRW